MSSQIRPMRKTSATKSQYLKRDTSMLKTSAWLLPICLMIIALSEKLQNGSTIQLVFAGLGALLGLVIFSTLIVGIWSFLSEKKIAVATSEVTGKPLPMRWEHRTFLWLIPISAVVLTISLLSDSPNVLEAGVAGAWVGFCFGALAELIVLLKAAYRFTKTKLRGNRTFENVKTVSRRVADLSAKAVRSVTSTHKQTSTGARYDNLLKLKQLLDQNVLTPEEFEAEKKRIMEAR